MQIYALSTAALLLAFTAGCKSKEKMTAENGATTTRTPAPPATDAVNTLPVPPAPPVPSEAEVDAQADQKLMDDSVYFSIERTPCFGSCPTYKLTIMQDGSATYVGRRFAEREGRYEGHVDPATMKLLKENAEQHDFYSMLDKYDKPVTDLPSVIIRVHADGRDKQVIGRVGSPQGFKNMTNEVEKLLANVEWTKVGDVR